MKRLAFVVGTVALVQVLAAQPAAAETLIVVEWGLSRSADVTGHLEDRVKWLDADPTDDNQCTECFAALELQHYLQAMTGRYDDFDIVAPHQIIDQTDLILIGASSFPTRRVSGDTAIKQFSGKLKLDRKHIAELGPEGYCIKSADVDGHRITLLASGGRVGTLHAAYDLLHRLGCRWVTPGEVNAVIPRIEKLPDLEITERPSVAASRAPGREEGVDPGVDPGVDQLLWMVRNRKSSRRTVETRSNLMRKLGIPMSRGSDEIGK